MGRRDDWFRNESWDPDIEAAFNEKLRRARDKTQYLRIQAVTLADRRPDVALTLIDRYFDLGGDAFNAWAYDTRAEIFLRRGDVDGAADAYEAALKREKDRPNVKSRALFEYPKFFDSERGVARRIAPGDCA